MQRDRSSVTALLTKRRATEAGIGPYPLTVAGTWSPPSSVSSVITRLTATGPAAASASGGAARLGGRASASLAAWSGRCSADVAVRVVLPHAIRGTTVTRRPLEVVNHG